MFEMTKLVNEPFQPKLCTCPAKPEPHNLFIFCTAMGPPPPPRLRYADAQSLDQYIKDSWDEDFERACHFLPMGSALTGRLKCLDCGTYAVQGSNYCLSCQPATYRVTTGDTNLGGPR